MPPRAAGAVPFKAKQPALLWTGRVVRPFPTIGDAFEERAVMRINISDEKVELGRRAAAEAASLIKQALKDRGEANIIVATGASQFEMLGELVFAADIAWDKVTAFHLDEYEGLPITHPASFRLYLWRRFVSQLPLPLRAFHYLNGEADMQAECDRVGQLISRHPIDVALVGIGENGHLAFNDPPANFDTEAPYLVVELDEACRRQQLGEGWFATLDDVPTRAISMSCRQIMKARTIVASIPDRRKAKAVQAAVEGPVTPDVPSSILQGHEHTTLYLDQESASLLAKR
jgi:glucosamine-6-phosphate deaminase